MGDLIGGFVIAMVAISPLLRRLYIQRFWIHARATVIRLEGGISTNPGAAGSWVWAPVIEYDVGRQKYTSRASYWQRFNAPSKYAVGDGMDIVYNPRNPSRFILDSWIQHIFYTVFISGLIAARLGHTR